MSDRRRADGGFALIEILLAVMIVGLVIGTGLYIVKHRDTKVPEKPVAKSPTVKKPIVKSYKVDADKVGTTDGIDQANSLESEEENDINGSHESIESKEATSTDASIKNIGGAYDEDSL